MIRQKSSCSTSSQYDKYKDIKAWVEQNGIPARRLAREFSDGVSMAVILKRIYPRHVDLALYLHCNVLQEKIDNYELLNNKVLSRIGVPMDRDTINRIARGIPGAIEVYLSKLIPETNKAFNKMKDTAKKESLTSLEELFDGTNPDYLTVDIEKEVEGSMLIVPQKMVSLSLYEGARQDSKDKSEYIENLKGEIGRLASLLQGAKNALSSLSEPNLIPKKKKQIDNWN